MPQQRLDLVRGTLDMLVLQTLRSGPMHGYAIARRLAERTRDALELEEGTLYPALHRMERKGWLQGEWGRSETNRRAKFYRLTEAGRRHLQAETEQWSRFVTAVSRVLKPA